MHLALTFRTAHWGVDTECRYPDIESRVTDYSSFGELLRSNTHVLQRLDWTDVQQLSPGVYYGAI